MVRNISFCEEEYSKLPPSQTNYDIEVAPWTFFPKGKTPESSFNEVLAVDVFLEEENSKLPPSQKEAVSGRRN